MIPPEDTFQLEAIASLHSINAASFIPLVIERLRGRDNPFESVFDVELRGLNGVESKTSKLRVRWRAESIPSGEAGVSDRVTTEWAALGLACVVCWHYAGLRIHSVGETGSRFDYWVRRGDAFAALEVSGTVTEPLESRYRDKVRQWQSSPILVDGFVFVADFASRRAIFGYHPTIEGEQ